MIELSEAKAFVLESIRVLEARDVALKDAGGRMAADEAVKQEMPAPVLDQRAGEDIGLGRIVGGNLPEAIAFDGGAHLRRSVRPDQRLGEIHRRGDERESGEARALAGVMQRAREQQREVAAHRRAHHDLWPVRLGAEHGEALFQPAADRPVEEVAAGLAMAGIVEAQEGAALARAEFVERARLGRAHVGFEPAHPDHAGRGGAGWRAAAKRDRPGFRACADIEKLQLLGIHGQIALMIRSRHFFSDAVGFAEPARRVNGCRSLRR